MHVLVGRAVDIEDVGAPPTGGGEPGLNLDVIITGSLDRIHSHRLDQFMPVANLFIRREAAGMSVAGRGGDGRHNRGSGGKHQPRRRIKSAGRQTRLVGQPGPE